VAQLCRHTDRLQAMNVHVALVSFGPARMARAWLQETGAPFPLWLDPQRRAYRAFGLERSLLRAWSPRGLLAYARLLASGRRWRGIQGDSLQLGGDVVVDAGGVVRFVHRSADPADRPDPERLLRLLADIVAPGA
jgi:hypothetical protein